ncbi:MAG TPA: hypothetical protein VHH35_14465, partial [Pyrinomonadaceae bacterium]|nr:hypothetical protein [Pyrinomonadaceae bacterium]
RHDYLPFGEELFAPAGGRSAAMGYSGGDAVRQQFTQKERDVETGWIISERDTTHRFKVALAVLIPTTQ